MNLEVRRQTYTDLSTQGEMYVDGAFECYTLEPPRGPKLIPARTYKVALEWSPRFQRLTPHILDVPGHEYEEIHVGNMPSNTEGCTLVGEGKGTDAVWSSEIAFEALMAKLQDPIIVTYTDLV